MIALVCSQCQTFLHLVLARKTPVENSRFHIRVFVIVVSKSLCEPNDGLRGAEKDAKIEVLKAQTAYLTTKEVMVLLQKRRNTICDWAKQGRIPSVRCGNSYRFDPTAIAEWLEVRSTGALIGGPVR